MKRNFFYILEDINININQRSSQVVNYLNAIKNKGAF